ncbi:LOW QUALITY PROTEIN: tartrate-resistant acid phosphatase type 5-like [Gigantopelta aegis]|uniref:LOW QUALITY PROTEIN: tartrate-resistant acid phosphatase type 5-like n=1 Tax=Gigantopelta aegis TaxID=1735272 RepID=UPI001B88C113|nr:LOW QUALITY PROTEIN: tartrate-resistant acid phosphatase type 5-like [Gigantopelta aegis]
MLFRLLHKLVKIDGDALNFVMLGDWGGQSDPPYYTTTEKKVATSMGAKAKEINSQFTVTLGDNFYDGGVESEDDPRFQTTFENIFTASSLQKRWYAVCGNHDHHGNISAQIAYTKKSSRWYMPDLYYTDDDIPHKSLKYLYGPFDPTESHGGFNTVSITDKTMVVTFFDNDECIHSKITSKTMVCAVRKPRSLCGPQSSKESEDEWTWIEDTLSKSTADGILVHGHYPVWSVAEHGPTQVLVDRLRPMLMKYNATAYFCGHDHDIQHIKEDGSNVNYFVSGAGSSYRLLYST